MVNPPPILPPTSPIATGPSAVGQGQNPPLPQLPAGTILTGTVSAQDANGNTTITTDALKLVLNTRYPLQKGSEVAVRLDQTLTAHMSANKTVNIQPQQLQIVQVDGKPAQPAPPAPTSSGAENAVQRELAKPVGMLLEAMPRGNAPAAKTESGVPNAPVRVAQATEVQLSDGQRAVAVLLRPAASAKAEALLTQLGAQASATLPSSAANALRPGLQLQVQVMQAPPASSSAAVTTPAPAQNAAPAAAPPASAPASSAPPTLAQPVASQAGASVTPTLPNPSAPQAPNAAASNPAPSNPAALASAPLPPAAADAPASAAVMRSGYASYAKQAPIPQAGMPPAPAAAGAPTPQGALPASTAVPVQVAQNLTPQAVEQLLQRAEAQPLPQGQIPAVVLGKESGGALIVQTRLGMFTLPQVSAESAQPGTVLNWQVRGIQIPAQTTEGLPPLGQAHTLATALGMTSEWSALDELTSVLQSMQSGMAAQAIQRAIPHVGSQMGAGLLFFMSILRKGDVHEWLGRDMVQQLERMGKGDLVQRLGGDLAAVRSLFVDQPVGNWQAMFFPVMVEGKLEHAQLYLKQEGEEEKKKGGGGTRFVVELDLSNLGPMQIDGFIKKREAATHFDLVLRTMAELPDDIKTDIYGIFDNAQKVAGFNGSINFRLVSEFTVRPLEEMQKAKGGEGGIVA